MSSRAKALQRRTKPSFAVRVRTFWAVGMLACCALTVIAFAVVNAPQLRVRDIQNRVRGRYPEAAALPDRPGLDRAKRRRRRRPASG